MYVSVDANQFGFSQIPSEALRHLLRSIREVVVTMETEFEAKELSSDLPLT